MPEGRSPSHGCMKEQSWKSTTFAARVVTHRLRERLCKYLLSANSSVGFKWDSQVLWCSLWPHSVGEPFLCLVLKPASISLTTQTNMLMGSYYEALHIEVIGNLQKVIGNLQKAMVLAFEGNQEMAVQAGSLVSLGQAYRDVQWAGRACIRYFRKVSLSPGSASATMDPKWQLLQLGDPYLGCPCNASPTILGSMPGLFFGNFQISR